jgi:hypothetical protein
MDGFAWLVEIVTNKLIKNKKDTWDEKFILS